MATTVDFPRSEPVTITDWADYQDGAVVSRTLGRTAGGTLSFFAFDAGQELSEHSSPFDAFVQVLEGEAELVIGGEPIAVGPGQVVCMPADVPHAVKAPRRFKMLLTMLKG